MSDILSGKIKVNGYKLSFARNRNNGELSAEKNPVRYPRITCRKGSLVVTYVLIEGKIIQVHACAADSREKKEIGSPQLRADKDEKKVCTM